MVSRNIFTHDVSFYCCQGQRDHNTCAELSSICAQVNSIEERKGGIYFCNLVTANNLYKNIDKLKKQYSKIGKKLFNNFNNTSIVTYHAPIQSYYKCGTLITGDIDLNHDIANLILKYFKAEIDKVGLFSIPHHGSDANWNEAFIKNGELDSSVGFAYTHNYYTNRLTTKMMSDFRCRNIAVDNEIRCLCASHIQCIDVLAFG